MTEDKFEELIKLLKDIDWKLWEMHKMMKSVLDPEDLNESNVENDN